jgi:hypothetical protein
VANWIPDYELIIQLLREPPESALFVYDAVFVQRALREHYELGPPPSAAPETHGATTR